VSPHTTHSSPLQLPPPCTKQHCHGTVISQDSTVNITKHISPQQLPHPAQNITITEWLYLKKEQFCHITKYLNPLQLRPPCTEQHHHGTIISQNSSVTLQNTSARCSSLHPVQNSTVTEWLSKNSTVTLQNTSARCSFLHSAQNSTVMKRLYLRTVLSNYKTQQPAAAPSTLHKTALSWNGNISGQYCQITKHSSTLQLPPLCTKQHCHGTVISQDSTVPLQNTSARCSSLHSAKNRTVTER
jgi:hypothetical protein